MNSSHPTSDSKSSHSPHPEASPRPHPRQSVEDRNPKLSAILIALWICTAILIGGALYFARTMLVPLAIAFLASFALRPIVVKLYRWRIPRAISAAGLLLVFTGLLAIGIATAAAPARSWLRTAPQQLAQVGQKLRGASEPFAFLDQAEEQLDKISEQNKDEETVKLELESPSIIDREVAINSLGRVFALLIAIGVLTFFLLATGDELINRLLHLMPSFGDERKIVSLILEIQNAVGRYLGTISLINIGLGIAVSLVMWLLGMPTPMLWGALATCFNFIPYIGAFAAASIIFLAAAAEFDPLWRAFLTTGCFLTLTSLEGNFITPTILGRTLRIGPVVVLLAITFWGFVWGVAGIFVAVPLLIAVRITCSKFKSTQPIAVLLGEEASVLQDAAAEGPMQASRSPAKRSETAVEKQGAPVG